MASSIHLVLFDVNETLSDLSPLRERFEEVGAPGHLLRIWFAGVLRDGFALTAAGAYAPFRDVAGDVLRGLLSAIDGWQGDPGHAAAYILDAFDDLDVHADVPDGVRQLSEAGVRLATLTNGATATTERLLTRSGLRDRFELLLDVSVPRAWKPAAAAYQYATSQLAVDPAGAVLVATHPWDIDGARRAGLQGAWLRRGASSYPTVMTPPTHQAGDLRELAQILVEHN
jgi:2-haloacid dehalogenase